MPPHIMYVHIHPKTYEFHAYDLVCNLKAKKFLANMDVPTYASSLADGRLLVPSHNDEIALNTEVRKLLAGTRNKSKLIIVHSN